MAIRQNVRCDKTGVVFDVSQKRIYVKDIKKLTNAQIEVLECGDYVVKKTGLQKHTYRVSYKEEKQGICLTYTDATTSETVSFDYIDGVWTFNSQDITNLGNGTGGGSNVVANPTLSGNEEELTGLEVDGEKYKVPQQTTLYRYFFRIEVGMGDYNEEWLISFISSQNVDVSDADETNIYTILTTLLNGKLGVTCLQFGINNSQTYMLTNTVGGLTWTGAITSETTFLGDSSNYVSVGAYKGTV